MSLFNSFLLLLCTVSFKIAHGGLIVGLRCPSASTTATTSFFKPSLEYRGNRLQRSIPSRISFAATSADTALSSGADGSLQNKTSRDEQRDMQSLLRWARKNGIHFADGVELQKNPNNGGWGVMATQPLRKGTKALVVPRKLVVSSPSTEKLVKGEFDKAFGILQKADVYDYKPEFLLVVRMLLEHALGEKSNYHVWVQSLPSTFSTGIWMDEFEQSFLTKDSRVVLDLQQRQYDAFFKAAQTLSDERIQSIFAKNDGGTIFQWAFSVVFSRSWRYSGDEGSDAVSNIVPLGDMFNHSGERANAGVQDFLSEDSYLELTQDVSKGSELTISYGVPYNQFRLLVVFGFFDIGCEEIFSNMNFPGKDQDEALVDMGCTDPSKLVFRVDAGLAANAVWDASLYIALSSNPKEQRALHDAHLRGDRKAKSALHAKHNLQASVLLGEHVRKTINELYPSQLMGVELKREDYEQHSNLRMIIEHNRWMRVAFGRVFDRVNGMVQQEIKK